MPICFRYKERVGVKRKRRLKPSLRRWSYENLLIAVKQYLFNHAIKWNDSKYIYPIYVEKVSSELRASKGMVDQCFADLNKQGYVTQRKNLSRHAEIGCAWIASMYFLRKGKFDDT